MPKLLLPPPQKSCLCWAGKTEHKDPEDLDTLDLGLEEMKARDRCPFRGHRRRAGRHAWRPTHSATPALSPAVSRLLRGPLEDWLVQRGGPWLHSTSKAGQTQVTGGRTRTSEPDEGPHVSVQRRKVSAATCSRTLSHAGDEAATSSETGQGGGAGRLHRTTEGTRPGWVLYPFLKTNESLGSSRGSCMATAPCSEASPSPRTGTCLAFGELESSLPQTCYQAHEAGLRGHL